ncbi:MAG TPA: glycerate kinase, partial [Gemmatimonadota bacterium]|nr:glycerate kinase [Gemmatimonadota bacterium]
AVFLGARIVPGAAWVMERVGFAERLAGADAVVTGEGAWDRSSEAGKITAEVLRRASERGVPAALLCGRLASKPPACVRALDGGGARLDEEGLAALAARAARSLQEPGGAR